MKLIGELAVLDIAFFFALAALIFTSTEHSVSSQVINRTRLLFSLPYLVILHLLLFRNPLSIQNNKDVTQALDAAPGFMKLPDN